jgi:hypothetical protein
MGTSSLKNRSVMRSNLSDDERITNEPRILLEQAICRGLHD